MPVSLCFSCFPTLTKTGSSRGWTGHGETPHRVLPSESPRGLSLGTEVVAVNPWWSMYQSHDTVMTLWHDVSRWTHDGIISHDTIIWCILQMSHSSWAVCLWVGALLTACKTFLNFSPGTAFLDITTWPSASCFWCLSRQVGLGRSRLSYFGLDSWRLVKLLWSMWSSF